MHLTKHAQTRSQQRGIPPVMVDLLLQFGITESAGDGASKMFFNKAARRKVESYFGPLAPLINQHLDFYAVVGADDQVITIGRRLERIRRH